MAVRFNKGDISEAILCAAIAAKFKKRLSARQLNNDPIISIGDLPPINYQDVRSILTDMVGSGYSLSLIHISSPRDSMTSRMPSSA